MEINTNNSLSSVYASSQGIQSPHNTANVSDSTSSQEGLAAMPASSGGSNGEGSTLGNEILKGILLDILV